MRAALLSLLAIAVATAQAPTGGIQGVVLDSASHQPVKKATVSINSMGAMRGDVRSQAPQPVTTDVSGTFTFSNLPAGQYQLTVNHQNYPEARMGGTRKTVQVSAGETTSGVTVELIPGAAVSGHVVDEDGDPMNGCIVQPHAAKRLNEGAGFMHSPATHEDGSYRLYGIPPGKYVISAQCPAYSVFQPRPLSDGPDPPPAAAYPMLFYPAARDPKSAQILELSPGTEKSGVDFDMRPVAVTHIHGTLVAGSPDWRGRSDLQIQLAPIDNTAPRAIGLNGGAQISKDGTFDLRQVFPGSYRLVVFSQNFSASAISDTSNRVGGMLRVDVADKPLDVSLQLQRAMDISGRVEIERGNDTKSQIAASQIQLRLTSENLFGTPPAPTQVNDDGSFTIKSVLPGEWRIRLMAPLAFVKSVSLGNDDVTHRPLDLTSGSAAPLRIVVSTNTATIRGTAPAGQMVYSTPLDEDDPAQGWRAAAGDSNGQFTLQGLAPGRYRITAADAGAPMPEEGGQDITVGAGESVMIDVKPETKP